MIASHFRESYIKITASVILSSCILHRKQYSFVITLSLEVTVTVADLFIGMYVPDTYRILNPSSYQPIALKEVHRPSFGSFVPLSNFVPFSTRSDQEAFRLHPSDHISLLSRFLSTKLAKACAYMSRVATYRICISTISSSSAIFYSWNTCTGEPIFLARSAYRRRVRGISDVQPRAAGYRGRR